MVFMSILPTQRLVSMDTSEAFSDSRKRTYTDRTEQETLSSQSTPEPSPAFKKARTDSSRSTPDSSSHIDLQALLESDSTMESMDDESESEDERSSSPLPQNLSSSSHTYVAQSKLGEGSFGKVYKVTNEGGEVCALKSCFNKKDCFSAAKRERDNLTLMTRENAPHSTPLKDSFTSGRKRMIKGDSPTLNLVTKFAEGESLSKLRKQSGTLSLWEITTLAKQMLENLTVLHSQGIAHADLNPYNVLFDKKSGQATVLDLGAAHHVENEDLQAFLYSLRLEFRAPEYVLGMKPDTTIDLWNVGTHIFALLTGQRFMGDANSDAEYISQLVDRMGPDALELLKGNELEEVAFPGGSTWTSSRKSWKAVMEEVAKERSWTNEEMKPIINLLERLLAVNPKDRLSASELLKLPLFQNDVSFRLTASLPPSIKEKCNFIITPKNGSHSFTYAADSLDKTCVHLPNGAKSYDVSLKWKSGIPVTPIQNMEISSGDDVVFRAFYEGTTPQDVDMDDDSAPLRTAGSTSSHH
jgi:serine/threonine protein kinase